VTLIFDFWNWYKLFNEDLLQIIVDHFKFSTALRQTLAELE